jgi:hypothetical protein
MSQIFLQMRSIMSTNWLNGWLNKLENFLDPPGMFVNITIKFVDKVKDTPLGQDDGVL